MGLAWVVQLVWDMDMVTLAQTGVPMLRSLQPDLLSSISKNTAVTFSHLPPVRMGHGPGLDSSSGALQKSGVLQT